MAASLQPLLDIGRWRRVWPYTKALLAYLRGDFGIALREYELVMRHDPLRTTERMAFLAQLLILNRGPPKQYLELLKRVIAGEFRDDEGSEYAKAYSQYWLAFLLSQPDVMKWWMDAYALRPKKGWASRFLKLPNNPFVEWPTE